MTTSLRTAPTRPPLFLVSPLFPGVNQEFGSLIFSIFLESFDHWLPGLTNESVDRVTCVAPPAPTPPATRPSWRKFAQLWTEGDPAGDRAGPPGWRAGPVSWWVQSYGTVRLPVSLCLSSPGLGVSRILWGGRWQARAEADRPEWLQTSGCANTQCCHTVPQSLSLPVTAATNNWECHQVIPGAAWLWYAVTGDNLCPVRMSDSPVSDQAPEDLRSDTTKKKSAGRDRPDSGWESLPLSLSPQRYYCLLYSPVSCANVSEATGAHLAGKLVMFGIKSSQQWQEL